MDRPLSKAKSFACLLDLADNVDVQQSLLENKHVTLFPGLTASILCHKPSRTAWRHQQTRPMNVYSIVRHAWRDKPKGTKFVVNGDVHSRNFVKAFNYEKTRTLGYADGVTKSLSTQSMQNNISTSLTDLRFWHNNGVFRTECSAVYLFPSRRAINMLSLQLRNE